MPRETRRDTAGEGTRERRAGPTRLSRLAAGRRGRAPRASTRRSAGPRCSASSRGRGPPSAITNCADSFATFGSPTEVCRPLPAPLRGSRLSRAGPGTACGRQQAWRRGPRRSRGVGLDPPRRTHRRHAGLSRGTRGPRGDRPTARPALNVGTARGRLNAACARACRPADRDPRGRGRGARRLARGRPCPSGQRLGLRALLPRRDPSRGRADARL